MFSAFLKFLVIAAAVLFVLNPFTEEQWRQAISGYEQPSRDEERSEKFPLNKSGIEIPDDDDIVLPHHGFSLVNLGAEVSIRYPFPRTPFPSNSYCEITSPPPWM